MTPLKVRVSTFRHAVGLVQIGLGGVVAVAIPLFAMGTGDASTALWAASWVAPLCLGVGGAILIATCRYAEFDPQAREVRLSREPALPWSRVAGLWIVAGPSRGDEDAPTRSLLLVTDAAAPAWLEAFASAYADLAEAPELPAQPYLKREGVLDALKAPAAGALVPLLESASSQRAETVTAQVASLLEVPVLDMGRPKSPRFRRFETS